MGVSLFQSCSTDCSAPAPNPSPSRWTLLRVEQFANAHMMVVRYTDCVNFEGIKVMVFRGQYIERERLDPHFSEGGESPIARFRPDAVGLSMARYIAKQVSDGIW